MKTLLQEMLFLDEKTGKFSTSKFMLLVSFYLIVAVNLIAIKKWEQQTGFCRLYDCLPNLINSVKNLGVFNLEDKDVQIKDNKTYLLQPSKLNSFLCNQGKKKKSVI